MYVASTYVPSHKLLTIWELGLHRAEFGASLAWIESSIDKAPFGSQSILGQTIFGTDEYLHQV